MAADLDIVPRFLLTISSAARVTRLSTAGASKEESADRWLDLLATESPFRLPASRDTPSVRAVSWQLKNLAKASALKLKELESRSRGAKAARLRDLELQCLQLARLTKHLRASPVTTTPAERLSEIAKVLAKARRNKAYPADARESLSGAVAELRRDVQRGKYVPRWIVRNRDRGIEQRPRVPADVISWRRATVRMHAKDNDQTVESFAASIGLNDSTLRAIIREAADRKKSNPATRNRLLRALGLSLAEWYAPRPAAK